MQVKIYRKDHGVEEVETTVLAADGVEDPGGATVQVGPGAAAYWRDSLDVSGWETSGVVLHRSLAVWGEAGAVAPGRDEAELGPVSYTLFSAETLRDDVAELYVDGISVLSRDAAGLLGFTDDMACDEEGGDA